MLSVAVYSTTTSSQCPQWESAHTNALGVSVFSHSTSSYENYIILSRDSTHDAPWRLGEWRAFFDDASVLSITLFSSVVCASDYVKSRKTGKRAGCTQHSQPPAKKTTTSQKLQRPLPEEAMDIEETRRKFEIVGVCSPKQIIPENGSSGLSDLEGDSEEGLCVAKSTSVYVSQDRTLTSSTSGKMPILHQKQESYINDTVSDSEDDDVARTGDGVLDAPATACTSLYIEDSMHKTSAVDSRPSISRDSALYVHDTESDSE